VPPLNAVPLRLFTTATEKNELILSLTLNSHNSGTRKSREDLIADSDFL
jgi:hypothetical protein